jgi:hypothetical protein
MSKYLYFEPKGGFNDILCGINTCLDYCIKNKRVLLINGMKSVYKINFSDYFDIISNTKIILDIEQITRICLGECTSVYPNFLEDKIKEVIEEKIYFNYVGPRCYSYNKINLMLPDSEVEEDLIVYSCCGGGRGFECFQNVVFKKNIIEICNKKYQLLKKPYLGIQVRNTDCTCDYVDFFNHHENLIRSYEEVYLATDDVDVLRFFKEKKPTIKNFTSYPDEHYSSLHYSHVDPNTKFTDMISDIYLLSLSSELISPSKGGYIKLIKDIRNSNLKF